MFIQTADHPVEMKAFSIGTDVTGCNMFHTCFANNMHELYRVFQENTEILKLHVGINSLNNIRKGCWGQKLLLKKLEA